MSPQSTRKGIVRRSLRLSRQIDDIERTLMDIYKVADGRSDYIDEWVPILIQYLEQFKSTCERFRQGL